MHRTLYPLLSLRSQAPMRGEECVWNHLVVQCLYSIRKVNSNPLLKVSPCHSCVMSCGSTILLTLSLTMQVFGHLFYDEPFDNASFQEIKKKSFQYEDSSPYLMVEHGDFKSQVSKFEAHLPFYCCKGHLNSSCFLCRK